MQYESIKKQTYLIPYIWSLLKHLYLTIRGYRPVGEDYEYAYYRRGEKTKKKER